MPRLVIAWIVVLCALAAGAAPVAQLRAGTYVPGNPDSASPPADSFEYQPGIIKVNNKGRSWEIPVMAHYPPPRNGGMGVILALQEPSEIQHPYYPLVLYRLVAGHPGVMLSFDSVRGTPAEARAQARSLWRRGQPRSRDAELYVTQGVREQWSQLPPVPTADTPRMLELTRGILQFVLQTALRGSRTIPPGDVIFYLAGQGYDPFSSAPLLKEWTHEHMADPEVRKLYEDVQSTYLRLRPARRKR